MDAKRTADYLLSLEPDDTPFLCALRRFAVQEGVPIVRPETEGFLRTMVRLKKPQRILEIGAAIGFSAVVMAEEQRKACGQADLVTIESWEKRIPQAKENISRAGLTGEVRLVHGDAALVLPTFPNDSFDFVFLDAAKGQYVLWLPEILRVMKNGGVLLADNVLQGGTVLEPRETVVRRERTTHERMREFLYEIKHRSELSTSVLPLGDGVSLSVLHEQDGTDQTSECG